MPPARTRFLPVGRSIVRRASRLGRRSWRASHLTAACPGAQQAARRWRALHVYDGVPQAVGELPPSVEDRLRSSARWGSAPSSARRSWTRSQLPARTFPAGSPATERALPAVRGSSTTPSSHTGPFRCPVAVIARHPGWDRAVWQAGARGRSPPVCSGCWGSWPMHPCGCLGCRSTPVPASTGSLAPEGGHLSGSGQSLRPRLNWVSRG